MKEAWAFEGEVAQLGGGTVTLVEGTSFCLSDTSGDVGLGAPQGLFFRDPGSCRLGSFGSTTTRSNH